MKCGNGSKSPYFLALIASLELVVGCGGGTEGHGSVSNSSLAQTSPVSGGADLAFSSEFRVVLTEQEKQNAAALGPGGSDCLLAIKAQDTVIEQYIVGKRQVLSRLHGVDLAKTKLVAQSDSQSCSQPSATVSASYGGTGSATSRDQNTETRASGAGTGPIQGPLQTDLDEHTGTQSNTLTVGLSLTVPLGCTVVTNRESLDENHFMRESLSALLRQPVFCDLLRKCPLGLKPDKLEGSSACGGSGFGGMFPGGPGGGPGGGGR